MKKKIFGLIFFLGFCFFPTKTLAAEKLQTCHYEENLIGAYLYFWDDGTVTGEQYYDGHELDRPRAVEEYTDDLQTVIDHFNESLECPKYIVSYRVTDIGIGWGVVRYKFFYDEESKNAFVEEYDSWATKSYWASLKSSTSPEKLPENSVGENEVRYQKTYETILSNEFGDVTFTFKYDTEKEIFTQTIMRFTDSETQPSIIDQSIDHFKTDILEKTMNEQFPESIYCGTIASYLTVKKNVAIIAGGNEIKNGDVVCSFDRTLFNDSTNKLIRFHNHDYGEIDHESEGKENFSPNELCKNEENCDISLNGFCGEPTVSRVLKFIGLIIFIAKILVPAIIIIMGFVNLFKIMTSGKEDEAKKQVKNIIRNIVIGILIFLLPSLINLVFDIADDIISPGETSDFANCVNCLTDPNDSNKCIIQESDD